METFDDRSSGSFITDFGTGGAITGTYSNISITNADMYGGAGGAGKYAVTFNTPGYELDLSSTLPQGVNYFGLWLSALDAGNGLQIYSGSDVYNWTAADLPTSVDSAYLGNPASPWHVDGGEKFVFANFTSTSAITKVVFSGYGGGFETDNHTVGFVAPASTGLTAGVPEPGVWALMILGFGGVGVALRRKRQLTIAA